LRGAIPKGIDRHVTKKSGPFSSVRRGEGWDEESGGLLVFTEGVKMPLPGNDELATFVDA
jgi:hypothetical protein